MVDKVDLLSRMPLFAGLASDELARIAALTEDVEVAAGTVLTHEGRYEGWFYLVVAGTVEIARAGAAVDTVGAGGFVGESRCSTPGRAPQPPRRSRPASCSRSTTASSMRSSRRARRSAKGSRRRWRRGSGGWTRRRSRGPSASIGDEADVADDQASAPGQDDRLAVWRRLGGLGPRVVAGAQLVVGDKTLLDDEPLERG